MSNQKNFKEAVFTNPPNPYWIASTEQTNYPSLDKDIKVDVAIVGGGITGITLAYLLKKAGVKVIIVEADKIIQGTTGHTTAKVTSQHTLIYNKIKKQMGTEKAKQYADANQQAIDMIENLASENGIDCDFYRCPAYVYTHLDEYVKKIQNEAGTAEELGIPAQYLDSIPLPFEVKAALRFDNQARFHPRKYLLGLAKQIPGDGCHIFEGTKAVNIEKGSIPTVLTDKGPRISASKVVLASHYPFFNTPGMYYARLFPSRSYVVAAKVKEEFPGGMYITAEEPGRSLRSQPSEHGELVLGAGEHHKTGQGENTNNHYIKLIDFLDMTFQVDEVLYRWSTQDYETPDGVPYVGPLTADHPNIYVATGYAKWGMTNGTAAAMILRDLITQGSSPWAPVYDPLRFTPVASAKTFIKENTNVAVEFVKGKLKAVPADLDIPKGEGKVVEVDGQKVGAYRDEQGKLHLVDITCTHMRCELSWNEAEKSWDCPCHGSRFTYEGEVIEGPTVKPLEHIHYD